MSVIVERVALIAWREARYGDVRVFHILRAALLLLRCADADYAPFSLMLFAFITSLFCRCHAVAAFITLCLIRRLLIDYGYRCRAFSRVFALHIAATAATRHFFDAAAERYAVFFDADITLLSRHDAAYAVFTYVNSRRQHRYAEYQPIDIDGVTTPASHCCC